MAVPQPPWPKLPNGPLTLSGFPLFEFDRRPLDKLVLRGFVLAWSSQVTLVHLLDDYTYRLNGYCAVLNADIKNWRDVPKEDFLARAASLQRLRPKMPPGLKLGSMKELLASAGERFPLLTIHRERIKKDVCYVGRFLKANSRSVTLLDISRQAEWKGEERYQIRDITRLDFGGAYETLLSRLADGHQR